MEQDLKKLTKDELLLKFEDMSHVVEAIELKDSEILKKNEKIKSLEKALHELNVETNRLKSKLEQDNHLADGIQAKDKELGTLKTQMDIKQREYKELNGKYEGVASELSETKETLQKLDQELVKRSKVLSAYVSAYRSFMKNIQGGLENSIELEALIFDTLK